MKRILVTGATGRIGRRVVSQLVDIGVEVRAMTRSPESAGLSGAEVVRGDLTVPETLAPCLDGIDAVFLVWTIPVTTAAAALDQIADHARRIVFPTLTGGHGGPPLQLLLIAQLH